MTSAPPSTTVHPTVETGPPADDAPVPSPRPRAGAEFVLRLFAITVPALYAVGRLYAASWWETIGLPPSLERFAFEDYLFLGFYAVIGSAGAFYAEGIGWRLLQAPILVGLMVLFFLSTNWVMDWVAIRIRERAGTLLDTPRLRWMRPVVATPFVKVPAVSAAITLPLIAALTTLLFFIVLPLVMAERAGARDAGRLRERLARGVDVEEFPLAHLAPGIAHSGTARLVQCTPEWCVLFAAGAFHALPKAAILQAGPTRLVPLPPPPPAKAAKPGP